jgi:hypothetical protein
MRRLLFCLPFLAFVANAWADGLFAPPAPGTVPIASVSALASAQLPTTNAIALGGYYQNGDGGGGQFARATCTPDGGTCFAAGDGSTWKRVGPTVNASVLWFGAKCDALNTVFDGSITAGSNQFTSTAYTFQTSDIGKYVEMNPGGGVNPWITTITAVSGHVATLANNAFNNYPGNVKASDVNFISTVDGGTDNPGSGYKPNDTLTATGGTFSSAATATVVATGLVSYTINSGGTGYTAGDVLTMNSNTAGVSGPGAIILVLTAPGGVIGTTSIVTGGHYKSPSSHINPSSFTATGGSGTGFSITLGASDSSFGIADVNLLAQGLYSVLPPLPTSTTDSGTGTNATIEFSFGSPSWWIGTDDTTAIQNAEAWAEQSPVRAVFNALNFPGGNACLASALTVNRAVTWTASNSKSTELVMLLGSTGGSVNGSRPAFVTIAVGYPTNDTYQASGGAQNQTKFSGLQIIGMSNSTTVNVGASSGVSTSTDCVVLTNPVAGSHVNSAQVMYDMQIEFCPGNALGSNGWSGEFRGYNIKAGSSGGNCLDFQQIANPTRFYGLVLNGCTEGLNAVSATSLEFHGLSVFKNSDTDISITGSRNKTTAGYILLDGVQFGKSTNENMYLDQQNETVYCTALCRFAGANQGGAGSGPNDADVTIGADVASSTGIPQLALSIQNGTFGMQNTDENVYFTTGCSCNVSVDGATRNTDTGVISTNSQDLLKSPYTFASQAAPTVSSGFGSSPSIVKNNGPQGFQVNVGTGGSASSGVIGLPTAPNGWACSVADVTTPATNFTKQTASSTTTATVTNYGTSNTATGWTASDKLNMSCSPY